MKHGPNALIDETLPVVCIATKAPTIPRASSSTKKTLSNIQEVTARSGRVIAIAIEGDEIKQLVEHTIQIPPGIRTALRVISRLTFWAGIESPRSENFMIPGAIKPTSSRYCIHCSKVAWQTWEDAKGMVERLKSTPGMRRSYLLDAYKCPAGPGWHVGRNYKLQWMFLCSGEHK
jgi:hypothetical protein